MIYKFICQKKSLEGLLRMFYWSCKSYGKSSSNSLADTVGLVDCEQDGVWKILVEATEGVVMTVDDCAR